MQEKEGASTSRSNILERAEKEKQDNSSILANGRAEDRGTNAGRFGIGCLDMVCSHLIASISSFSMSKVIS